MMLEWPLTYEEVPLVGGIPVGLQYASLHASSGIILTTQQSTQEEAVELVMPCMIWS